MRPTLVIGRALITMIVYLLHIAILLVLLNLEFVRTVQEKLLITLAVVVQIKMGLHTYLYHTMAINRQIVVVQMALIVQAHHHVPVERPLMVYIVCQTHKLSCKSVFFLLN